MGTLIWSLPILFMLHDFEEIIMFEAWQQRYQEKLNSIKYKPFDHFKSAASGSVAVLVEFIILSLAALLTNQFHTYLLWFGCQFIFILHFFGHYGLSLFFKGYVPGLTTALLFLPISIYNLLKFFPLLEHISILKIVSISLLSILLFGIFFKYLTHSIAVFAKLLAHYAHN